MKGLCRLDRVHSGMTCAVFVKQFLVLLDDDNFSFIDEYDLEIFIAESKETRFSFY